MADARPLGEIGVDRYIDGTAEPGLFDGRSQLVVYHFMFGPEYTKGGCPTCSSMADAFDGLLPHLNNRDVTFLAISRAPLEQLQAYKRRMGWQFPWASSSGSDFNFDFGVSFTKEQQEGGSIEYNYRSFDPTPLLEARQRPGCRRMRPRRGRTWRATPARHRE